MYDRKGRISVIRVSLIVGVIGLLLIGGGVAALFLDQNARRSPLEITPYPGSQYWGASNVQDTSRNVFYRSSDTPEAVAAYYAQKLVEHYGNNDQTCVRLPPTGNMDTSTKNPNTPPYSFRCVFDNSGLNSTQFTQVEIWPGQANTDPSLDAAGMTVIEYKEQWMR